MNMTLCKIGKSHILAYLVAVATALGWQQKEAWAEALTPKIAERKFSYTDPLPPHLSNLGEIDTSLWDGNAVTDDGAHLGRILFFDRRLSENQLVSCGSCHSPEIGFDDPNRLSIGFKGELTRRHSIGLVNARFNSNGRALRDERMPSLEAQMLDPIFDPKEMGLKPGEPEKRLAEDPLYPNLFERAFGSGTITEKRIADALAQFVRSFVSGTSAYDRERDKGQAPTADFQGFSPAENRGKHLFFTSIEDGGGNCVACHQTDAFVMLEAKNNGLPAKNNPDFAQKTRGASLKNIAVRAPFMSGGQVPTLEAVVEHYSSEIEENSALSAELKRADGSVRRAGFSEEDKRALVAFLRTLTDTNFLNDPKFSNPFFAER